MLSTSCILLPFSNLRVTTIKTGRQIKDLSHLIKTCVYNSHVSIDLAITLSDKPCTPPLTPKATSYVNRYDLSPFSFS